MSNTMVGRVVGGYRLDAAIGSGNLGSVYQGMPVSGGAPVALKIVFDTLTGDAGFPDRFAGVASAAARLQHPNVARVLTHGRDHDEFYLVMELLERGSLRTMLERREDRPSLGRCVELVRQAAEALGYAHSQGVVHRDIKPENIMLSRPEGASGASVRVADFGMMQLIDTGVTMVGKMAPGSPRYMSPEQCSGRPPEARSDIYSLGVVLYEAATGYPPFQVNTMAEAIDKHLSASPAAPRQVNQAIPPELERIILKCMAKKVADRYSSAFDLARELTAVSEELNQHKRRIQVDGVREPDQPKVRIVGPPSDERPAQGGGKIRVKLAGSDAEEPRSAPKAPEPRRNEGVREGERIRVQVPGSEKRRERSRTPEKPVAEVAAGPGQRAESKFVKISLDRPIITLIPGQPTVLRATIFNGTKIVDHFQFSVEGVPANWVQLPPSPPQLNPGDRTAVNITVNVPRIPESHARTYSVYIRVAAMRQSSEFASATGEWTVTPFVSAMMTLSPSRARAWKQASFGIRIRNEGNAPARYNLVAHDDEAVLNYRFGETAISLGPGDSTTLRVGLRSRTRWIGSTEARTFMVRAEPVANLDGTPPIPQTPPVAPGQYLHRAIIPMWLIPLLLLLAVGLWFWWNRRTQFQLAVTPARVSVAVGATAPIKATVTNVKGEAVDSLAKQVRWVVDDTTVALVTDSGQVRGRKAGTTLITASVLKRTQQLEVTVTLAQVANLTVAPPQLGLVVGGRGQFRAVPKDDQGKVLARDVQWMSSNPMVANVANGQVIASDTGVATVTAMSEGKMATAVVTVAPNAEMRRQIAAEKAAAAAAAAGAGEDCIVYDPALLKTLRDRNVGWLVTDGSNTVATLDEELDARRAMQVAKGYRKHCYLGRNNRRPNRNNFIIEYWRDRTEAPVVVENPDCVPFDPKALKVQENGAQGHVLMDGRRVVLNADNQKDATTIWNYAQEYTQQCFVGRGNRRPNQRDYIVQYWR